MESETIVAVATPPGAGAVGVLRLSGPDAVAMADKVFRPLHRQVSLGETANYHLRHGLVTDPASGEVADEVLAFVARGPRSYTGEDVVEFSGHGGTAPMSAVLQALLEAGARPARPGEFTMRAFLNGRMDLSQAEAVADVVRARSRQALTGAVEGLQGKLGARIEACSKELVAILAHLEAALDFDDQEVPPVSLAELGADMARVEGELEALVRGARAGRLYREGLRVVLAGRPNVGKSSLLNALSGRERAIVTELPGTTRDVVEETLVVKGVPVSLVDTAGLRETEDRIEAEGVRRARAALEAASVAVLVVDGSAPLSCGDREAARVMPVPPAVVVANKADLGRVVSQDDLRRLAAEARVVEVSALEREGLEGFWSAVMAAAGLSSADGGGVEGREGVLVTNVRHEEALRRASEELGRARAEAKSGSEELVAVCVRAAVRALGEITGESVDEEVLTAIFSTFCVGK